MQMWGHSCGFAVVPVAACRERETALLPGKLPDLGERGVPVPREDVRKPFRSAADRGSPSRQERMALGSPPPAARSSLIPAGRTYGPPAAHRRC